MLKRGDILVCIRELSGDLTYSKKYLIISVRNLPEEDICIIDDTGYRWWFGQVGSSEPWTNFFMTEKQWNRNLKLNELL